MDAQLLLDVTEGAAGLRIAANGVELFRDEGGDGRRVSIRMPLDEWLLPAAENRLSVTVLPGPGEEPIRVRLGTPVPDDLPLAQLDWRPANGEPVPFTLEWPFVTPGPVRTKLWTQAVSFGRELPTEAREAAVAKGLELYEAFAAKDEARLAELLRYKCEDVALAWGCGPDEVLASHLRAFHRPHFALEPLHLGDVRATLVGGGRAVLLTRGDAPWLACVPERYFSPLSFSVCVALVDGAWVVAR